MAANTFLSAAVGGGIVRAQRQGDETWQVSQVLSASRVNCLAVDPLDNRIVFAGTQGDGLHWSEDAGRTWAPAGLEGHVVKAVAASPLQPGLVFAGTKPAHIYRSEDHGRSWQELDAFRRVRGRWLWFSPAEPPGTAYVQGLALSPRNPAVLVAGIEFGAVVRSEDGGKSWSSHLAGSLRDCHSLTFHGSDGDWIYEAGGSGGGAAFSRDGGRTWNKHKAGLDRNYGWACAADPSDPATWYVSMAPGPMKAHGRGSAEAHIFRSRAGAPWQKLAGGLPQPLDDMPYALLTDADSPGHLYAGLSNGEVWHSSDYGDSWTQLSLTLGPLRTLILL